jgi:hypothetical protein
MAIGIYSGIASDNTAIYPAPHGSDITISQRYVLGYRDIAFDTVI